MKSIKILRTTVQGQKFVIKKLENELFTVKTTDTFGNTYESSQMSFSQVGNWIWNMSDNHDISSKVNSRMCDFFNLTF